MVIPFKNIFKRSDTSVFAIQTGTFAGELWVLTKEETDNFHFLAIPTMENRTTTRAIFESGKKSGIVKLVEKLPIKVHKICVAQFNKNAK